MTHTTDRDISVILDELYKITDRPKEDLSVLCRTNSLKAWLNRLSYISDFKKGGDKLKKLAAHVIEYLELANGDEAFRNLFFAIIEDAATTCGDRMALSVLDLGIAKRIAKVDRNDLRELADLLIHGSWVRLQLQDIAQAKVSALRFVDEIEVHLAYPVMLGKRLGLPLDVEEMLYFRFSNVSEEDLESAYRQVVSNLHDLDQTCAFLADQSLWRQALKRKYPDAYAVALEAENPAEALAALTQDKRGEWLGSLRSTADDEKQQD
jgi:hypothetical protein